MAQVKFKDETEVIKFGGAHEDINVNNLTVEKYQWLIAKFPSYADKFNFVDDVVADAPVSKSKSKE